MQKIKIVLGVVLRSPGLSWSLQGADWIRMKPILCFANCEPVVGGSLTWLVVGIVALAVGFGVLVRAMRKRQP